MFCGTDWSSSDVMATTAPPTASAAAIVTPTVAVVVPITMLPMISLRPHFAPGLNVEVVLDRSDGLD